MKLSALPLLACPTCRGMLTAADSPALPRVMATGDAEEMQEGLLRCSGCETEYPVLSGVAVLTPKPSEYLRRFYLSVTRDLDRYGRLTSTGRAWLTKRCGRNAGREEYGADFRFSQQFERPADVAGAMVEDPDALYGGFADWLRGIESPYDVLASWAGAAGQRHLALDAGCGGGGLVARLAAGYGQVFGIDLSFLAILLARRCLLHQPEPERSYYLSVRRDQDVERPLPTRLTRNAELFVGDATALPFPDGLFDTVCSTNVIDIVGIEKPLDEAARTTRPEGRVLVTAPFYFADGQAPKGEPKALLREALERRGVHLEAERDGVPWAWATYDRHWRLYFNYCVAGRKQAKGL